MLQLLYFFTLLYCASAHPVRTSLCCCGCSTEPCPIVAAHCASARAPCSTDPTEEAIVRCDELQRLWEMAVEENKNGTISIPPGQEIPSIPSPGFTPFNSETGQNIQIYQEDSKNKNILNELPVVAQAVDLPSLSRRPFRLEEVMIASTDPKLELRYSPKKTNDRAENAQKLLAEKVKAYEKATFDKLDGILEDLQKMINTVRSMIEEEKKISKERHERAENEEEKEDKDLLPLGSLKESEEREVLSDVLKKMKRHSRILAQSPVNAVDSSVSSASVDVHSPLFIQKISRTRRAIVDESKTKVQPTGNCNDSDLKDIVLNNISTDPRLSKRAIQAAAEKHFGGTFNVICSPCEFSFVISSQKYCEGSKNQVACFVFLQPKTTREVAP